MTPSSPEISVIIPVYNEEDLLGQTLREVRMHLSTLGLQFEIIVVDDGSTDATPHVIAHACEESHETRSISFEKNRGKGAAVTAGILSAKGECVLFMDADQSVPITYLSPFMQYLSEGYDVVIASIGIEGAVIEDVHHRIRRFAGRLSKFLIKLTAVPGIYDTQRGFKLFSCNAAKCIFSEVRISRWGFDIEALVVAQEKKLKVKEVPVIWKNVKTSDIGPVDYLQTLGDLCVIIARSFRGIYRQK